MRFPFNFNKMKSKKETLTLLFYYFYFNPLHFFIYFSAMLSTNAQEEAKLAAMQRAWQPNRRLASTLSLFEEEANLEEFITSSAVQVKCSKNRSIEINTNI